MNEHLVVKGNEPRHIQRVVDELLRKIERLEAKLRQVEREKRSGN